MRCAKLIIVLIALIATTNDYRAITPNRESKAWWPASGTVILAGGGFKQKTADDLVDRMIALAGGPEAVIVVIPTASVKEQTLPRSGAQPANVDNVRHHLESRGAKHIVFLHTLDRKVANSEEFVKVLQSANAVFLTGGASRVLDNTYHDTLVERELKAVLKRGGVLVGDSAGAITLGCFWIDWNPQINAYGIASKGMCVLPDVAVTPHVHDIAGDERTLDVQAYISAHPPTIGINIQESTFLVLRGNEAEVFGTGGVSFFDSAKDKVKPYLTLLAGNRHDLEK